MLAERGVSVDHITLYRWVQRYAPEMEKRLRWYWPQPSGFCSWYLDETYIKVNGKWAYLYRAVSHKDWPSRRQRQKQGIERAHTLGKYRGKQADQERHQKVLYYRQVKKLSIRETADATGYSVSRICRIQALYREKGVS